MPPIAAHYAEQTLTGAERIVMRAGRHWAQWVGVIFATVATAWLIAPLIWLAPLLVRMATTEVTITNQRFIVKKGWLNRDTDEIPLDAIETIHVHQGWIGRVLGAGRLAVRGAGGGEVITPIIARVIAVRRSLQNAAKGL